MRRSYFTTEDTGDAREGELKEGSGMAVLEVNISITSAAQASVIV
jgi:hypothetical protein